MIKEHWRMTVTINYIISNKKDFLHLLLLGDETESVIDKYLEHGELFAPYSFRPVGMP